MIRAHLLKKLISLSNPSIRINPFSLHKSSQPTEQEQKNRRLSSFKIRASKSDAPDLGKVDINGWILLLIPVATFGLGLWQVYRWRWKLGLIDEMEKIVGAETVEFSDVKLDDDWKSLEYKKVRVKGRFDSSKDVLLGPRSLISGSGGESIPQGLISQGSKTSGYYVITPFHVSGQDVTILVNRGWIPSRKVEQYQASGDEVEITGVVRGPEPRSPFMSKNRPENGLWMFRDLPSLAEYFHSSEFYLDLSSSTSLNQGKIQPESKSPIPGQTRVSLRNEHVSYFVTWFSLSGITGYMWYKMYILGKRRIR